VLFLSRKQIRPDQVHLEYWTKPEMPADATETVDTNPDDSSPNPPKETAE
jgi:hypothetical protein